MWIGEYSAGNTIDFKFTTRNTVGVPTTLSGSPVVSVYKDNATAESTAGVTLTVDFDSRTGLNHVRITTSSDATFYADGSDFQAVITTGTVSGASVVGETVAHFTLRNRAGLKPTTAGRTLDVSSGGEAGIDWANVGSPTTTVNLSGTSTKALEPTTAGRTLDVTATGEAGVDWANIGGATATVNLSNTTIKTATDVESDTVDIQSRLPAALVSGRMDSSVGAMAANVLTASALATDAVTEIQTGLATQSSVDVIDDYLDTEIAAIKAKTDNLPSDPADASDIAASFTTVNGKLDVIDDFLDTEIAAIKAKTDNLPTDPADASDITAAFGTVNSSLAAIAGYIDTEVAAIKSKTDQLTFTIPLRVDAQVLGMATDTLTADALASSAVSEIQAGLSSGSSQVIEVVKVEQTIEVVTEEA